MMKPALSIVIPCYHAAKSLPLLVAEIAAQGWLKQYDAEVILVNDGSGDGTWAAICQLAEQYSFCRGIDLARNVGQHNAILAGMTVAAGDVIVGLDDDLQTHPSQIPLLLAKLEEGYDVVYGRFVNRCHSAPRNLFSALSEMSARWLLDKPKELRACPMYAVRRFVRDEIVRSPSAYTNLLGLFLRTTSRVANVDIQHRDRACGQSGYTLRKLLRLWSAYLNYSIKPIRLLLTLGGGMLSAGLIWILCAWGDSGFLPAWMLLLTGLLVLCMGLVGEYVGRMFMIVAKEPQFVVREDTGKNQASYPDPRSRQRPDRSD